MKEGLGSEKYWNCSKQADNVKATTLPAVEGDTPSCAPPTFDPESSQNDAENIASSSVSKNNLFKLGMFLSVIICDGQVLHYLKFPFYSGLFC